METPDQLLRANVQLVQRIVGRACRRARLQPADAEDFASEVMIALMENDYAIVRKFEGRSSFGGFLSVVIDRLLLNRFVAERGKWTASAEAQRLGAAAVALERLIYRDGRPLDAALPIVQSIDPAITRAAAEEILQRLPLRTTRPHAVDIDAVDPNAIPSREHADARAIDADISRTAQEASRVVRTHLETLPPQQRTLLRLRFGADMSVADIARAMQVPQRPLYRELETLLARLRGVLRASRIDETTAAELIGTACESQLDFGLADWKNTDANRSLNEESQ